MVYHTNPETYVENNHIQYDTTLPINPDKSCSVCENDPSKPEYKVHYYRNHLLQVVHMCTNCNRVVE